ncbi:MAG TPA: hypothetical protein VNH64_05620 [Parvularculaceae bacterium]|nr:hypothetical protein [Parvularculaceae bacterium]
MSKAKTGNASMPEKPKEPAFTKSLGGSDHARFNSIIFNDVIRTIFVPNGPSKEEWRNAAVDTALHALHGINPQTEHEGMIAAQMVASHAAAMECYRRAAIPEQTFEGRKMALMQASKATRSFALLTECLQKIRGESPSQAIHVHHHHTDARTQVAAQNATVNMNGEREGGGEKNGEQPHERTAIEHKPGETVDFGEALRGEEPRRERVPRASDEGKAPVPAARRQEPRRAEGEGER